MTVQGGWSPRVHAAWGAAALCTACSVAGLVFQVLTHDTVVPLDFGSRSAVAILAGVFMVMPIVGALVAVRRPESPIGWLFVTIGATMAVWVLCDGAAVYALLTDRDHSKGGPGWRGWPTGSPSSAGD